jgi:PIN domain nuclease of toxin-antitoxin system
MRLLLDSHIFLWLNLDRARIPRPVLDVLSDSANDLWLSASSVWEIAIKTAAGRLAFATSAIAAAKSFGIGLLDISPEDAEAAAALPKIHADPFDRMLVAQAARRDLVLVTADAMILDYPVAVLPAR